MTITKAFKINFPNYNTDIPNLDFTTSVDGVQFKFNFQFFNNQWNGWGTFNNQIRLIGVVPLIYNWLNYFDYTIFFNTSLDQIGKTDLINTELWILKWA